MKRVELIEWGIITVGLILGFSFVTTLLGLIMQPIFTGRLETEITVKMLLVSAIYLVAFIVLIRKSDKLAEFINGPARANETIALKIGKRALLHVIIISVCIISLLSSVTTIVYGIFNLFKKEVSSRGLSDMMNNFGSGYNEHELITGIIQAIFAIVVIFFSKNIADALIKKNELDELTFDSNPGN